VPATPRRVGFLDRLQALPDVQIVHVDEAREREAWRRLRARGERDYSFVDATSFAVMRRRRIREALAFDDDFNAAGFGEVRGGRLSRELSSFWRAGRAGS